MTPSPSNDRIAGTNLEWSHATNSSSKLKAAIEDVNITAIECDILLGEKESLSKRREEAKGGEDATASNVAMTSGTTTLERDAATIPETKKEPILSHPPNRASDLTVDEFLQVVTEKSNRPATTSLLLQKHIKLDFKEVEVLQPTLDILKGKHISSCDNDNDEDKDNNTTHDKIVFLNADILPGPGMRTSDHVTASTFLDSCLAFVDDMTDLKCSLSLGYKCDWACSEGYTASDVSAMSKLVESYKLMEKNVGLVLALNARLLACRVDAFDEFLIEYDSSQILAWTGSGEPPIPTSTVVRIKDHFASTSMEGRIGFDCIVDGAR